MQSRITIEVDFENGNAPYIRIFRSQTDDVRDKLVQDFLDRLKYSSEWLHLEFCENSIVKIRPLPPEKLVEEGNKMINRMQDQPLLNEWDKEPKMHASQQIQD